MPVWLPQEKRPPWPSSIHLEGNRHPGPPVRIWLADVSIWQAALGTRQKFCPQPGSGIDLQASCEPEASSSHAQEGPQACGAVALAPATWDSRKRPEAHRTG